MTMDWLDMGGYGLYIWLVYGVGLVTICAIAWIPHFLHTRTKRTLIEKQKRDEAR